MNFILYQASATTLKYNHIQNFSTDRTSLNIQSIIIINQNLASLFELAYFLLR
jgi:hypothetical protein